MEILRDFFTFRFSDLVIMLTYRFMDNFCYGFHFIFEPKKRFAFKFLGENQPNIGPFHLKPCNFRPKFSFKYNSVGPMRVHTPEYQPPVTSGSRVTERTNFVN